MLPKGPSPIDLPSPPILQPVRWFQVPNWQYLFRNPPAISIRASVPATLRRHSWLGCRV